MGYKAALGLVNRQNNRQQVPVVSWSHSVLES